MGDSNAVSFPRASRFICNFIWEYFLKTCASPWQPTSWRNGAGGSTNVHGHEIPAPPVNLWRRNKTEPGQKIEEAKGKAIEID